MKYLETGKLEFTVEEWETYIEMPSSFRLMKDPEDNTIMTQENWVKFFNEACLKGAHHLGDILGIDIEEAKNLANALSIERMKKLIYVTEEGREIV